MKNHVYLAAAISLSCATEPMVETQEVSEAGVVVVASPATALPSVAQPTGEEIEARIAARMAATAEAERVATAALPSVHGTGATTFTRVQRAPGAYADCFSELPARRRSCRQMFNRRLSETALIRRMGPDQELLDVTRLVLGRIILSEANWPHDERRDRYFPEQNHAEIDAPAIYQVLRHTRMRGETLLGAARRHAPHVSEARAIDGRLTLRRMSWISRLQLTCNRPSGFPETDRAGNQISWDDDGYRSRCEQLFALAQRFLDGDAAEPWASAPLVTWGGRCEDVEGACDDHLADDRGLVPYDTGNTANRFWCRPGPGCEGPPLEVVVAN